MVIFSGKAPKIRSFIDGLNQSERDKLEKSYNYNPNSSDSELVFWFTSNKSNLQKIKPEKEAYSWNNFLETTTNSDNNPFGVYFNLSQDLESQITKRTGKTEKDLNASGGFLSYRKCDESGWKSEKIANITKQSYGRDSNYRNKEEYTAALKEANNADYSKFDSSDRSEKHCPITTPGTQLSGLLNKSLGADTDEIITADEFDEIIGALIGQLTKKLLSGGVKNTSGNSYDNDYVDPNFEIAKKELAKRYKADAYNIEIKILESSLRTVQNSKANHKSAIACWTDKKNGIMSYRRVSESAYEKITIDNAINILNAIDNDTINSRIIKAEERLNNKIIAVQKNAKNAINASQSISAAKDYGEFIKAKDAAEGIKPAKIQEEIQKRDFTNLIFDNMVNGERSGEFDGSKEYRLGGFNELLNYCNSFNLESYPRSVDIQNVSKDIKDKHIETITVIDPYNPTEDLYDLEDEEYLDDNKIIDIVNPEGACIAKDKTVANGAENLSLQFYKPLDLKNCRKATNAKCIDTKFVHSGLPTGVDYPNDFWLETTNEDGESTECGEVIN